MPFSYKESGLLKEWLIVAPGKEMYNMSLEHFVLPESKETCNQASKQTTKTLNDGDISKGHRTQLKEIPVAKTGTI